MIEPVISPLSALARNATCAGDLVGLEQAAERPALLGCLQPAVLGAVIGLHDAVLARRVHPADGQPVDADAVVHDAVGDVLGERDQRALGGAIGGDEALAAMAGHRDDVDDRAFDLLALHHLQAMLHQEERRPHIDREHGVEQRRLGIPDRAAIGQAGRVDEDIDAAERLVGGGDDLFGILGDGKVGRHEDRLGALGLERGPDLFAARRIAAGDDEAGSAALGKQMGDRLAEPLRGAGDDGDLAFERKRFQRRQIEHRFTLPSQACRTGATRSRHRPAFARAARHCHPATGFLPSTTASMKASTSLR